MSGIKLEPGRVYSTNADSGEWLLVAADDAEPVTHYLVPAAVWNGVEPVLRAAKWVFEYDPMSTLDGRLKALRKALESYRTGTGR